MLVYCSFFCYICSFSILFFIWHGTNDGLMDDVWDGRMDGWIDGTTWLFACKGGMVHGMLDTSGDDDEGKFLYRC